jgi:hypothetical protein
VLPRKIIPSPEPAFYIKIFGSEDLLDIGRKHVIKLHGSVSVCGNALSMC